MTDRNKVICFNLPTVPYIPSTAYRGENISLGGGKKTPDEGRSTYSSQLIRDFLTVEETAVTTQTRTEVCILTQSSVWLGPYFST